MFQSNLSRFVGRAFAALGLAVALASAVSAQYQTVSQTSVVIASPGGNLVRTDTVVQDGPLAINRFTMHQLRREKSLIRGNVLLLPALGNNFNSYLSHETGNAAKSFGGQMALAGFNVWGYSPRETGIATADCGATLDCTPILDWGMATIVRDATYIRSKIVAQNPNRKIAIGGLSLGAISALAVVNARPNDYDALLAWEGSIKTADPAIQAHNQNFCAQYSGLVAAGVPVDNQSLPLVKLLANLSQTAPNDPFVVPIPGFPPGLTNRQAFLLVLTTPNPVAPSPRPGFISAAGDFLAGVLFHSDEARLATNIATFNDVTSNRVVRDLYCSLSGAQTAFNGGLANFTRPVMIVKAGAGFGSIMDELPGFVGSTAVNFTQMNDFGHVDHLGSPSRTILLDIPVILWLGHVL